MDGDRSEYLKDQLLSANESAEAIFISGGASKSFYGYGPCEQASLLDVTCHSGIIDYQPDELFIRVRSGTPLSEVEKVLAAKGQRLAFEPPAYSATTTLGGVVATGLSGPGRCYAGAVRDYVLGVTLLSGDAVQMSFGGQVMKNVAGYDISRLMAGSMGMLGIILDTSLKVLPQPETELTLCQSLDKQDAVDKMIELSRLALPVSATLYYSDSLYIRLSGNEAAVLDGMNRIGGEQCAGEIWGRVKNHELPEFKQCKNLWRVSAKSNSRDLLDDAVVVEWGGGLRWLMDPEFNPREKLGADSQGTLFRYESHPKEELFQPLQPRVLQIHKNLKNSFDPNGILNTGHMYPGL